MTDRDGECVRGIQGGRNLQAQNRANHSVDLFFVGASGTYDRAFDHGRGIFTHGDASSGSQEHGHAAGVSEDHCCLCITVEERLFDGHGSWAVFLNDLFDLVGDGGQAQWERGVFGGSGNTVRYVDETVATAHHEAVATAMGSWIDAEDERSVLHATTKASTLLLSLATSNKLL